MPHTHSTPTSGPILVDRSTTRKSDWALRTAAGYVGRVPKRSRVQGSPRDHVDGWPDGTPDTAVAAYAQQIALRLAEAMDGRSIRDLARAADLDHTTVAGLLSGAYWPDVVTIAKCEQALGVRLWPDLV